MFRVTTPDTMEAVISGKSMQASESTLRPNQRLIALPLSAYFAKLSSCVLPTFAITLLILFGFGVMQLYRLGEYAAAIVILLVGASASYVLLHKQMEGWRFIYPALLLIFLLILFPILYSMSISFTNYSSKNLLSYERAVNFLLTQTYVEKSDRYLFKLYRRGMQFQLQLDKGDGQRLESHLFSFAEPATATSEKFVLDLFPAQAEPEEQPLQLREVIKLRAQLQTLSLQTAGGQHLSMYGLREFLPLLQQFQPVSNAPFAPPTSDQILLLDNQSQRYVQADQQQGAFYYLDEHGEFTSERVGPGFVIQVGFDNYLRMFGGDEEQRVLMKLSVWTICFATIAVATQFALGLLMASLLNWHRIKGQRLFRTFLLIPFAVPGFVSIMIFRAMFNPQFGEINQLLMSLFGMHFDWYGDPWMARLQVLLVALWLGFPFFMLMAMGLLNSIPQDLYEAADMDGAGTWYKFRFITLPMVIKPMLPLLILSFTANINNFGLIFMLTGGQPQMADSTLSVGDTDLLINYVYKISYESYQDYGLASALSAMLFVAVAAIALIQFGYSRDKRRQSLQQEY